jgi:hypothetical protein
MWVWSGVGTKVLVPAPIPLIFVWVITHARTRIQNVSFCPTYCGYFLWILIDYESNYYLRKMS